MMRKRGRCAMIAVFLVAIVIFGIILGADPIVVYAYYTDNPPSDGNYWGNLNSLGTGSAVDKNSRWNTYTHQGLPPTPISAPSLKALQATASPQSTSRYFFYNKPKTGDLVCEATFAQIQANEQRDHLNQ